MSTRLMSPLEHAAREERCPGRFKHLIEPGDFFGHRCVNCGKAWNEYWQPRAKGSAP